uniref:Uncharacterized protein n=2 Tax=Lepeophtheirus salmonis TaxID=72036 RepID=A0A0K2VCF9_LEPSM
MLYSEGEDELKKRQLMELAIINGTYRDSNSKTSSPGLDAQNRYLTQAGTQQALQTMVNQQNALRSAAPLGGAPLILSPRLQVPTTLSSAVGGLLNGSGGPPPLIAANDTQGLLYAQYAAAASDYANYPGLVSPLLATAEYADPTGYQQCTVPC